MLETGTKAPDFTLLDQDGEAVSLAELKGTTVVLYFYPKADTPGCTTQACGVRDHLPDYTAAGVRVLGVSPDPVKLVRKFHDKQALNFTLLADEDHAVCEAYGVWAEKSMYGRTYWGAKRSTFIIDAGGTVAHVIPKASPKTHDEDVRVFESGGGRAVAILGRGLARRLEVAFEVDPAHRGGGLATAALLEARRVAGPRALLFAQTAPANIPSLRALLRAGFAPIGAEALFFEAP